MVILLVSGVTIGLAEHSFEQRVSDRDDLGRRDHFPRDLVGDFDADNRKAPHDLASAVVSKVQPGALAHKGNHVFCFGLDVAATTTAAVEALGAQAPRTRGVNAIGPAYSLGHDLSLQ